MKKEGVPPEIPEETEDDIMARIVERHGEAWPPPDYSSKIYTVWGNNGEEFLRQDPDEARILDEIGRLLKS